MTIEAPVRASTNQRGVGLKEYLRLAGGKTCKFCNTPLRNKIDHYAHSDGWKVMYYTNRLWLSIKCPKCDYDWSLQKLGVPRSTGDWTG